MPGETLPEVIAAPSRAAQDLSKAPEKAQTGMAVREVSAGEEAAAETATSFPAKQKKEAHKEESTIRIEVKKLDELMNLAGELVLGKNRLISAQQPDKEERCDGERPRQPRRYHELHRGCHKRVAALRHAGEARADKQALQQGAEACEGPVGRLQEGDRPDHGGRGDGAGPFAHRGPVRPAGAHHKELCRPRRRDAGREGAERQAEKGPSFPQGV